MRKSALREAPYPQSIFDGFFLVSSVAKKIIPNSLERELKPYLLSALSGWNRNKELTDIYIFLKIAIEQMELPFPFKILRDFL